MRPFHFSRQESKLRRLFLLDLDDDFARLFVKDCDFVALFKSIAFNFVRRNLETCLSYFGDGVSSCRVFNVVKLSIRHHQLAVVAVKLGASYVHVSHNLFDVFP